MRVLICEDSVLLREGLIRLLTDAGHEVVAALADATTLVETAGELAPEIAVIDVRLPPTFTDEGLRVAIEARAQHPDLPVMVLSQYVEQLYARELMDSGDGGLGYLLKDRVSDVPAFIASVRQVAAGGTVLDPDVVRQLLARQTSGSPVERLTAREREVLELMAEGRSNAAIAAAMFVTQKAVTKHIGAIFTKLDLPASSDDNRRVLAVLTYLSGS